MVILLLCLSPFWAECAQQQKWNPFIFHFGAHVWDGLKSQIKLVSKLSIFQAYRHSPFHSEMKVALSHLLLPEKHFPRLSLLIALFLFFFLHRRKRKKEKEKDKKKISCPRTCTAFFTGPLVSLGDSAKKKLHSVENSHFSLNPQFKHDPE